MAASSTGASIINTLMGIGTDYTSKAGNQNGGATFGSALGEPSANTAAGGTTKNPLQLQQNLKNVLCTTLCMSAEDVDKLFEKASEN